MWHSKLWQIKWKMQLLFNWPSKENHNSILAKRATLQYIRSWALQLLLSVVSGAAVQRAPWILISSVWYLIDSYGRLHACGYFQIGMIDHAVSPLVWLLGKFRSIIHIDTQQNLPAEALYYYSIMGLRLITPIVISSFSQWNGQKSTPIDGFSTELLCNVCKWTLLPKMWKRRASEQKWFMWRFISQCPLEYLCSYYFIGTEEETHCGSEILVQ